MAGHLSVGPCLQHRFIGSVEVGPFSSVRTSLEEFLSDRPWSSHAGLTMQRTEPSPKREARTSFH